MNRINLFKYIILLSLWGTSLHSQDWVDLIRSSEADFRQAQQVFDEDWDNREYEKGNGYKQFKRWENFIIPRMDKYGRYDPTAAWNRFARYRAARGPNAREAGSWEPLGPVRPPGDSNSSGIGRIDCIAFHPQDSSIYWVGAPSGGLWQTTNDGKSWHTSSDDWEGLGISDILIDPAKPDTMYVATGDRDHYAVHSYGILKTVNGGQTWSPSGLSNLSRIYKLLMDPDDAQIIFAATVSGLYRSADGGQNWALIPSIPEQNIFDIAFKPGQNDTIYTIAYDAVYDYDISQYIRTFGFYRSLDNGLTFEELALPFPGSDINRAEIGVTAHAPDHVYLYCSDAATSTLYGLYKSVENGENFTKIADPSDPVVHPENSTALTITNVLLYQGWYDWTMQVNPMDSAEMYLGGAGMIRTFDGGDTWEYVAGYNSGGGEIHVDFHAVEYHPITNRTFVGCDGGMWRQPYEGLVWTSLNDSLVTTQNYTFSSSSDGTNLLVGNQDNSTFYYNGAEWDIITGGDGMGCIIDPAKPELLFTSSQQGIIYKIDNGVFQLSLSSQITNQPCRWETAIRMDPIFRNNLYTIYKDVWKSTDSGDSWQNLSMGKINSPHQVLEQIEIAESNADYIYVADRYELFRTTDGGETWDDITRAWQQYEGIGDIEIDPNNPDRVWIVTWQGRVFVTENGGGSWTNISGTLPSITANNIIYQKGSDDGLYVAMDVGVFYRDNTMTDWMPFYNDLPNVVVLDLEILYCTGELRAATYGRGVWETDLINFDAAAVCCNIDIPTLSTTGELLVCGEPSYMLSSSAAPAGNTYQWYKDGKIIAGATSATYDAVETGIYTLRFMNGSCPSMASDPVDLTLLPNGICTETCSDLNVLTASGPGNTTVITITDSLHTPDENELIWICVTVNGDSGTEEELMNVYDEDNNLLGETIFGRDCTGPSPEACFYLSTADFTRWISDGALTITTDPQTNKIGLFCQNENANEVCVGLRYSILPSINCNGNLDVPSILNQVDYKAGDTLTSTAIIAAGDTTTFTAGSLIDLLPGFDAEASSIFDAYIEECSSLLPPIITAPSKNAFVDNGCENAREKREWQFEWTSIPDASSYHLLVYSSTELDPIIDEDALSTTSFSLKDFEAIENNNTKNWKAIVRAQVAGKWTIWSDLLPFNVEDLNTDCNSESRSANDIAEPEAVLQVEHPTLNKELLVMVHPNPATDLVNINYFLNKVVTFDINLYDVTGKRIQQIRAFKETDPGEHSTMLNTSELKEGMYFIVLKNKDFTISEKVIILRR